MADKEKQQLEEIVLLGTVVAAANKYDERLTDEQLDEALNSVDLS